MIKARKFVNDYFHWFLILPTMIILFIIIFYPALYAFYISFFVKRVLRGEYYFTGLGNYIEALQDPDFYNSMKYTFIYALSATSITIVVSTLLAMALNKVEKFRPIYLTAIMVPWVVPMTSSTISWKWIFHSIYGVLNYILSQIGIIDQYVFWLGKPVTAMIAIIIVEAWFEIPLATLLIFSGLQRIPEYLYEAAEIDGTNAWQRFKYITFILVKPEILMSLIVVTMFSLRRFGIPWLLTGGGPGKSTDLIGLLIYKNANRFLRQGYGAALGEILLFIIIIFVIIYFKIFQNKEGKVGTEL